MPLINRRLTTVVAGLSILGATGILTWTSAHEVDAFAAAETAANYRLTSVNVEDSKLTLAWHGEATKYRVRIGTDLKNPLLDTTTSDPIASLSELSSKTSRSGTLRYRIDNLSETESTKVLGGTITLPPATASKPKINELASNGLALAWDKVEHASHYDISFTAGKDSEPFAIHRISSDKPEFTIATLKPGTTGTVQVRAVRNGVLGEFSEARSFTTPAETSSFAVGAWNVCSESCKGYGSRSGAQAQAVQNANLDILTLQEAGGKRVGRTTNAAFSGGERGFVRATGGSKARYIFYREELFDQLDGGTFSVGHGRTVAWARLRDLKTEQAFIVASVHLSPDKGKNGVRGKQTSVLTSTIKRINSANEPVVLAGDYNSGVHRSGDQVMGRMSRAGYSDTVQIAKTTEGADMNSFNWNKTTPKRSGDYVDHIFVNSGFEVPLWRQQHPGVAGRVLTDHNLIAAKLTLSRTNVKVLKETTESVLLPSMTARDATTTEPQPEP